MDKDSKALIARIQRYTTQDIDELMEDCVHSIERLNAENARLREALGKIANEAWNTHAEFCHPDGCDSPGIARAALAEQGEKP